MGAYYFVAATLIAVIPLLILFKVIIEKIRENPEKQAYFLTRFILGVALIESLPIVLVVLGFINLERVKDISELYLPGAIILLSLVFALIFISLQRINDAEVNTGQFRILALAFLSAIPMVSLISLMLMLP